MGLFDLGVTGLPDLIKSPNIRVMRTKQTLLFFFSMLGYFASAQNKASLNGKIADASGYLPGVSIKVKNAQKGATTDLDGSFRLENLPVGKCDLLIAFIGYTAKEMSIDLQAGTNNAGTIALSEVNQSLNEVVVKGTMAPSQMKALSIKKNALGIMEVIAADAIGKLPDRNAAEAVQRMQGVSVARYHGEADQATVRGTPFSWTSTLFNGTRTPSASVYGSRNSILDAVPSEMIQYVQLSKALTPDLEGDAIGGSINFVMRTAPEKRTFNISAAGGYNQRSENGTFNGSLVYGDRFFKQKLGVIIASSIWDRNWATDELAIAYNTQLQAPTAVGAPDPRYSINTVNAKRYFGKRRTYGINAGLEYNFNASNKVYARTLIDKFDDIRPVYESFYDFNSNRYRFSYRYSNYETTINGVEVGGSHQIAPKIKVEWRGSDYTMKFTLNTPPVFDESKKGLPIAQFNQPLTGKYGNLAPDGRKYLKFDSPTGMGDDPLNIQPYLTNPTEDVLNPSKLLLQQLVVFELNQSERDQVGQLDFTINAADKLTLKVGGKYRTKARFGEQTANVFLPALLLRVPNAPPYVKLSDLQTSQYPLAERFFPEINSPFNNLISTPITEQQLYDIFTPEFFTRNGMVDRSANTNPTTKHEGTEDAIAGYAMATYEPSEKFRIIGGFRNEYTQIEMNGKRVDTKTSEVSNVVTDNAYNAFLPMFHVKYSPVSQANIRLAYTRTFVRANFTDLNPSEIVNVTTTVPTISRGNTGLKPTFSDNFDVMTEYFFQNIGLASVGFFHKNITDVIFLDISNENIGGVNYVVTQPKNLKTSSLTGFEAGITRRFNKLPGILGGFGVELNYSYVTSSVDVPRLVNGSVMVEKAQLPNQSQNMWNAILFYERNGLNLRLASNFRGKSIETFAQQLGPNFYVWADDNLTLDFSGSYAITPRLRVFVELNNLTNSYVGLYLGNNRNRLTSREWYSIRGQAGVKFDIF